MQLLLSKITELIEKEKCEIDKFIVTTDKEGNKECKLEFKKKA